MKGWSVFLPLYLWFLCYSTLVSILDREESTRKDSIPFVDGNDGLRMISIPWLYPFCLRTIFVRVFVIVERYCVFCVFPDLLNQSIHSVPRRCTDVQMKDESWQKTRFDLIFAVFKMKYFTIHSVAWSSFKFVKCKEVLWCRKLSCLFVVDGWGFKRENQQATTWTLSWFICFGLFLTLHIVSLCASLLCSLLAFLIFQSASILWLECKSLLPRDGSLSFSLNSVY